MYNSPISLMLSNAYNQMVQQQEDAIYTAVTNYLPYVDKEELIRALQYDRAQYDKGYADGQSDAKAALIRCKDCKNYGDEYFCPLLSLADYTDPNDFCSSAERKDGDCDV